MQDAKDKVIMKKHTVRKENEEISDNYCIGSGIISNNNDISLECSNGKSKIKIMLILVPGAHVI